MRDINNKKKKKLNILILEIFSDSRTGRCARADVQGAKVQA